MLDSNPGLLSRQYGGLPPCISNLWATKSPMTHHISHSQKTLLTFVLFISIPIAISTVGTELFTVLHSCTSVVFVWDQLSWQMSRTMSRDYCKTSFIHCSSSTSLAVGSTVPGLLLDLCLPNCYGDRLGKGRLEILEISTEKYHFKLSGFGSTLILFHNRIRNAVPVIEAWNWQQHHILFLGINLVIW